MRIVSCKKPAKEGELERSIRLELKKAGSSSATDLLVSSYIILLFCIWSTLVKFADPMSLRGNREM